jgi:hypothetical protein
MESWSHGVMESVCVDVWTCGRVSGVSEPNRYEQVIRAHTNKA